MLAPPPQSDRRHRHPAKRHVGRARSPDRTASAGPLTPDEVRDALKAVIDPELGLNIVDLGLIYDVAVEDRAVTVRYSLTTMACGLGPLIESGIKEVAGSLPFDDVRAELVFDPPWSPERISPEGKAFLGI
ncbi:MAG TPA: metal-sulfur cluster assembly factor [Acidimicrobiia bacterium]|nr:metal-sulfur cluster assembly factor [Acidimicrobiia bacterium]